MTKRDIVDACGSLLSVHRLNKRRRGSHSSHAQPIWSRWYGCCAKRSLCATGLQPLITRLNPSSLTKKIWYANDAADAGPLRELRNVLNGMEPSFGYYPNAKKWETKQGKEGAARELFRDTAINISAQGQKHLGAVLGSKTYLEEYVNGKVEGGMGR